MLTFTNPTVVTGHIGHHDPEALTRKEAQHQRAASELTRARRLRRWSDRMDRAASAMSRAAGASRASVVNSRL
jgi:hypothetical protein